MAVLPKGFLWGNSVSSMQYDGAQHEGGKGPSVYERYEGAWEEAVDGYHRFREDNALMQEMGFTCYRFQTSWSRVMPAGEGAVNEEGLAYYEALADDLLARGIEPMACLYHFDMPLALAERFDGFVSKHVVDAFVAFAQVVIDALAPKVKWWITFNEQNLYGVPMACRIAGAREPEDGYDETKVLQIAHNVMAAHARVANYLHENYPSCKIGVMCAFTPVYPATSDPRDVAAATAAERMSDWVVLDTAARGAYPAYYTAYLRRRGISLDVTADEMADIAHMRNDFAAFSYYRSECVSGAQVDDDTLATQIGTVGHVPNPYCKANEWGWEIDPLGFRRALSEIYERTGLPVFPIENGIGWREELPQNGTMVEDDYRISYHRAHIQALKDAVEKDGVPVLGYLGWGLIDIPSSGGDTEKRYGAVYVDYAAEGAGHLSRYPKKSFAWFKQVCESNGENLA